MPNTPQNAELCKMKVALGNSASMNDGLKSAKNGLEMKITGMFALAQAFSGQRPPTIPRFNSADATGDGEPEAKKLKMTSEASESAVLD